jgi:hypothetical protein
MSRDDSLLYTGSSSSSFAKAKLQPVVEEKKQDSQRKRAILIADDAGEIIIDILQREIDKYKNIEFANIKEILATGIPNALEIDMLSTDKTIDSLKSAQYIIKNIMRNNKNG